MILSGCRPAAPPALAPVEGRVTVRGRPLAYGLVVFVPDWGRPALGTLGPDGRYRLVTQMPRGAVAGAVIGRHRIAIVAARLKSGAALGELATSGRSVVEWLIPPRYQDCQTSNLAAIVHAGPNRCDLDLEEPPAGHKT